MFEGSSEALSQRLGGNWYIRCHESKADQGGLEDDGSLTDLGWLQNLSVAKLTSQFPQAIESAGIQEQERPSIQQNTLELYRQHCLNYGLVSREFPQSSRETTSQLSPLWQIISVSPSREICRPVVKRRPTMSAKLKNINKQIRRLESFPKKSGNHQFLSIVPVTLKTNGTLNSTLPVAKVISLEERDALRTNQSLGPGFNYSTLICMSMQALRKNEVTLDEIYSWIAENFAFYRDSEPTWKPALRQTLAKSQLFQRVPHRKGKPGGWNDRCRLYPNVYSEIPRLDAPNSLAQTRSRSPAIAQKLIIQSRIRPDTNHIDDEDDLPLPTKIGGSRDGSLSSNHQSQEPMTNSDWLTGELPQGNVDRLIGDLDYSSSYDPYPMEEFSTAIDEEEPTRSPMSEVHHPWTDEHLNLEELDDILGLK
ncbi:hypothetical protein Aperf_G00000122369 [Anoplocephala perfoliata]